METKTAPPPPMRRSAPPQQSKAGPMTPVAGTFSVVSGVRRKARRVVPYGTGGIGKTSLVAGLADVGLNPIFLDLEGGTEDMDVKALSGINSWETLRGALNSPELDPFDTVVLDTASKAEELAAKWVIANAPKADGDAATSLESFGYGKGYAYLCDQMTLLLADLDRIRDKGKNVILICHDCKASVPNPEGVDFIRYEPFLYHTKSGNSSVRDRVKNWADEILFIGYDVFVSNKGKAKGSGTRQIFCQEQATFVAKSRTLVGPYTYNKGDVQIWKDLFGKE